MQIPRIRPTAVLVAAAVMALGSVDGVASAAAAGRASLAHPAPYPAASADSSTDVVSGSIVPAAACTPYVDGDHAHVSSGDVSVHGWWYRNNCANTKTTVYVGLQEYYSDGTWRTKATGSKYVWPGGGSANRAVARHVCESVVPAGWRSYVIVHIGNGASAYTPAQNLACRTLK